MAKGDLWGRWYGQFSRWHYDSRAYPYLYSIPNYSVSVGYASYEAFAINNNRLVTLPFYYKNFNTNPLIVSSSFTFYSYDVSNPQDLTPPETVITLTFTEPGTWEIYGNYLYFNAAIGKFQFILQRVTADATQYNTRYYESADGINWTLVFNTASTTLSFSTQLDRVVSGFHWFPAMGKYVIICNRSYGNSGGDYTNAKIYSTTNFSSFSTILLNTWNNGDHAGLVSGSDLYLLYNRRNDWSYGTQNGVMKITSDGATSILYPAVSGQTRSASGISSNGFVFDKTGQILFSGYHSATGFTTTYGYWKPNAGGTALELVIPTTTTYSYGNNAYTSRVPLDIGTAQIEFIPLINDTSAMPLNRSDGASWNVPFPATFDLGGSPPGPNDFDPPVIYVPGLDDEDVQPPYIWVVGYTGSAAPYNIEARKFDILGNLVDSFTIGGMTTNTYGMGIAAKNDYVVIARRGVFYTRKPGGSIVSFNTNITSSTLAVQYAHNSFYIYVSNAYANYTLWGSRDGETWGVLSLPSGWTGPLFTSVAPTLVYDAINEKILHSTATTYESSDCSVGATSLLFLPMRNQLHTSTYVGNNTAPSFWGHPTVKGTTYYFAGVTSYFANTPTGVVKITADLVRTLIPLPTLPSGWSAYTALAIYTAANGHVKLCIVLRQTTPTTRYRIDLYELSLDDSALSFEATLYEGATYSSTSELYITGSVYDAPHRPVHVLTQPSDQYVSSYREKAGNTFIIENPLGQIALSALTAGFSGSYTGVYLPNGTLEEDPFWTEEDRCVEKAKLYGL